MILSLQVPPPKLPPSSTIWDWEKWVEKRFVISKGRNNRIYKPDHKSDDKWWRLHFLPNLKFLCQLWKKYFRQLVQTWLSFLAAIGVYETVHVVFVSFHLFSSHFVHHLVFFSEATLGLRIKYWWEMKSSGVNTWSFAVLILYCQWEHYAFPFLFLVKWGQKEEVVVAAQLKDKSCIV